MIARNAGVVAAACLVGLSVTAIHACAWKRGLPSAYRGPDGSRLVYKGAGFGKTHSPDHWALRRAAGVVPDGWLDKLPLPKPIVRRTAADRIGVWVAYRPPPLSIADLNGWIEIVSGSGEPMSRRAEALVSVRRDGWVYYFLEVDPERLRSKTLTVRVYRYDGSGPRAWAVEIAEFSDAAPR